MRTGLRGILWRLTVFMVVALFFVAAMFVVFAQIRFNSEDTYAADFTSVSGLEEGQHVRIAGVEVGKIKDISLHRDATVTVLFSTEESVVVTHGTRAVIRYADLVGGRYLSLEEGAGNGTVLRPGETIPLANTSPALDLDALIGGFKPLFRALDPDQVNALSSQLIDAFQGQGATINSFFTHVASLTSMLADRDQLIGDVIGNLNAVLTSLGDQNAQFAEAVDSFSQLMATLTDHKAGLSDAVASANSAAGSVADLLAQGREPLKTVLHEGDRAAGIVVADHDYVDDLLATLPEAYQMLGRQSLYGDFFAFYICDLLFKVNGKGGQPVFIKIAGQSTGRCAPK
ncbi:MCE family protein [[Mycobacterium] burgundiense]|uniref:MCE family protein n=1 Tax=[Mycobacterium] burgundiense TaxID=3064286 RepID=A0ABM9M4G0_9MYCO|nr:MCE family protein [Mycolicibacterium sp. MU0053]CAJ1510028.1 MCE family protein [Mycolicibacterium sp. MU0053]